MSRKSFSQVWLWGTLVSLAIALAGASQADSQAGSQETPSGETEAAAPQKKFQGRLPAYYRTVVDEKQRASIYAIQKEYWTQIEDLKAQLEALAKQRDEKIAAVLTPEQLKQVEATATAAKAKRATTKTTQK